MCFVFLAAVTAAINSALVELSAVVDCALDWCMMAPPPNVMAHPVVNLHFVRLFPQAASAKQISLDLVVSDGCMGIVSSFVWISGTGGFGRLSMVPVWWKMIPQCFVARECLAMDFKQWW